MHVRRFVLRKILQIIAVGTSLFLLPTTIKTQWNNYLPCDGLIVGAELSTSQPASELIPTGSFTIEGFLYFNQSEAAVTLLSLRDENDTVLYRLGKQGESLFYFDITDAHGKTWRVAAEETVPTGQWVHLAGVLQKEKHDYDALSLYINGARRGFVRDEIDLVTQGSTENQHPVLKLVGDGEKEIFSGRLDEVRISSCPRYTAPIVSSLDNTFSADSATIALWHFDEPFGGTSLADASIHGFELSLARSSTIWPLTLDDFAVSNYGKASLLLTWKTKNERELDGIEVQRRSALENFESIGFLPAHGLGNKQFDYNFSDIPNEDGRYYYRLKLEHSDGQCRFSSEVGVDFTASAN